MWLFPDFNYLPCSQQLATEQYHETEESNPQFEKFCFKNTLMIIFPFNFRSYKGLSPLGLQTCLFIMDGQTFRYLMFMQCNVYFIG